VITAINNVSLNIYKGEFLAIVGPSGCGKTTLLRLIAGFENANEGIIKIDGKKIEKPGLDRGIVFQEHRLMAWLTVLQNITLGLTGDKAQIRSKAQHYLKMVDLEEFKDVYPNQLSGGMAQRAAIARALICQPEILLLDEPFGALDALTRMRMQEEIGKIWLNERTTMVLITHDIEEAIYLADRIIVMTPRPAHVHATFRVPFQRIRNRSDPDFVELRKTIMASLNISQITFPA
jgi:sulfonate transport system ATP-binding protein